MDGLKNHKIEVQEVSVLGSSGDYGCSPCSRLGHDVDAVMAFETYRNDELVECEYMYGHHAEVASGNYQPTWRING